MLQSGMESEVALSPEDASETPRLQVRPSKVCGTRTQIIPGSRLDGKSLRVISKCRKSVSQLSVEVTNRSIVWPSTRYGASAPIEKLQERFDFTVDNVVAVCRSVVASAT